MPTAVASEATAAVLSAAIGADSGAVGAAVPRSEVEAASVGLEVRLRSCGLVAFAEALALLGTTCID